MIDRRSLLGAAGLAAFVPRAVRGWTPQPVAKGARVTLLGTAGGPPPHVDRSQPGSLLTVDGRTYLIDAGENVGQQLMRAGTPPSRVDVTLLTHLHWDHTLGLDYLMASGWMLGRTKPMPIWGPPGTRELIDRTLKAVAIGEDVFRAQTPDRPPLASLYPVEVVDVTSTRLLFDDGVVKASAVLNTHFGTLHSAPHTYGADKSYSYRLDTPYGSVVFTGDTGPSEPLTQFAKGADMLVAEIVDPGSIRQSMQAVGTSGAALDLLMQHMQSQHLTAEALGRMAQKSGVKTLVLTHFVVGPHFDPSSLLPTLRKAFPNGEIILGKDLRTIPIVRLI